MSARRFTQSISRSRQRETQFEIEIRDGKEFRVTRLPDAVPPPWKPQDSRKGFAAAKARRAKKAKYEAAAPSPRTKYPFAATINGNPVTVWPDWIEWEDADR